MHLKVTESELNSRLNSLFEYFITPCFIPPEKPLPLQNFLTTRGSETKTIHDLRPILDGRIYIPDSSRLDYREDYYHVDFSLSNLSIQRLFLKNLALLINALAGKNGVSSIQWSLSYPSNFSQKEKTIYCRFWQDITIELQTSTGITQLSPELDNTNFFRSKSLAFAQYFVDKEEMYLVSCTCINIEDSTSDISVWYENKLVHQCSVQLAERHLFTHFLELNHNFLTNRFDFKLSNWQELKSGEFNAKLDLWVRFESDNWLRDKGYLIEEESDFQGLLRLVAIGMAGLYYYIGTILRTLYKEEKYPPNEITPVYMGGNGSRLLNWLSSGGKFDRHAEINKLFSHMLSKGSGFENTKEITYLSKLPKDDVACGLVLNNTKLTGLDSQTKDPLIVGENCRVNGVLVNWENRLDIEGDINSFTIDELVELPIFLDDFNQAIKDLDLEGITPMEQFKPGQGLDDRYRDKLWKDTQRELKANLLKIKGDAYDVQIEPPFILGLKALLRVLGKEWAGR